MPVHQSQRSSARFAPSLWALLGLLLFVPITAAGEITILRDEYGTPSLFASTAEDACYALGYVEAQDRLVELLTQYRRATGTMSEAFGAQDQNLQNDYRQRLWQHAAISKRKYQQLSPTVRGLIESYQAGIRQYMTENPGAVPPWAPRLEPWMCVALGRYILWGWPEGEAAGDLTRGGIEPDPIEYHGSNEWLVAPSRTAQHAPIALIDPHLSWYGAFRFYEARLYGGEIQFSGMGILGLPLLGLGHSRYCSIAMTTGGPDCADCYLEEINPSNKRQYRYDGRWKDMAVRTEIVMVKEGDKQQPKKFEIDETIHGPVVARRGNKAYTLKLSYQDEVGLCDQTYKMCVAKNLAEMKQALAGLQLMEQNIMIGTVQGDIFYVRNGRVPIRPAGFDFKRPVPGTTSKSQWLGIYKFTDLLQIQNPPQGYMQNCNVSPQFMARGKIIDLKEWERRPELFNGFWSLQRHYDNPLHQRAAMVLELLDKAASMTAEQAIAIALSPDVYGADAWQALLEKAWNKADSKFKGDPHAAAFYKVIRSWNRRCEAERTGAVAYHYWKEEFPAVVKMHDKAGFPPPPSVNDELILATLRRGAEKMLTDFGTFDVRFGDVYRVGRKNSDRNWPVSGGSVDGLATPRAIGFDPIRRKGPPQFLGRSGQTSTQIVLLTNPPKSWTYLPLGESDDPKSGHYDDQAEKLFSPGRLKPTYFLDKTELMKHLGAKPVTILRK